MRSSLVGLGVWVLLAALGPSSVAAQDPAPADSVPADSVVVGELPGELVGVLADSAVVDTIFAVMSDPLRPGARSSAALVIEWDRGRIRRSNATSLLELLAEMVPGLTTLRSGFFAGPMHALDGPFGAGALRLTVDGRTIPGLIGAQPDLSEYPLSTIDVIRVTREGAGWHVELTTVRRTDRRAYSRIEAGSGDPDFESLRLVFTNGWGRNLAVHAGFDLIDAGNPDFGFQTFSGGVAFLPGGGRSGVELQLRNSSIDRGGALAETGSRSTVVIGGRLQPTDQVQASVWWSEASRNLDDPGPKLDVSMGAGELRGLWERGWGRAGVRVADAVWMPTVELSAEGGVTPINGIVVGAGVRLGDWDSFSTRELHAGVSASLPWLGITVGTDIIGGVRGIGNARGSLVGDADEIPRADSVGFSSLGGHVRAHTRGVHLGGSVRRQQMDRQIGFGSVFDSGGEIGPEAELLVFEGHADVPILPLSWLLNDWAPIRLRGHVRHNDLRSTTTPFYVPENLARAELYLEDEFLEGDLGLRLALGIDRRDAWLVPDGAGGAAQVAARTSLDFDLGIRLVGVLIYWRVDNLRGEVQADLPGQGFPTTRQVFGVRWEFFE